MRLPKDMTQRIVEMRNSGMLVKAIAYKLGLEYETVRHVIDRQVKLGAVTYSPRKPGRITDRYFFSVTGETNKLVAKLSKETGIIRNELYRKLIEEGLKTWTCGSSAADATSPTKPYSTKS